MRFAGVLAWLLLAAAGCGADPSPTLTSPRADAGVSIEAGRALWAAHEPTCQTYYYDRQAVNFASGVVTVQIANGQPQWRWYVGTAVNGTGVLMGVEWFEDMAMLGSHPGFPPASTVEQMWDECAVAIAGANPAFGTTIEVNAEGAPMTCVPATGCPGSSSPLEDPMPMCALGVFLSGFSCGTLQPPRLGDADGGIDADVVAQDAGDAADVGANE